MHDSLALEYYRRSGEAEAALKYPFSIFLTQRGGSPLVVTVDRHGRGLRVKHWDLRACGRRQRLPPFKEWVLPPGTPLRNERTVLPTCEMLPYHLPERFCRTKESRMDRLELDGHARDVEHYLNCDTHRAKRAWWLMEAFWDVFGRHLGFSLPMCEESSGGADSVVAGHPRAAALWKVWRRHLLDLPAGGQDVAAEVPFGDSYPRPPVKPFVYTPEPRAHPRMDSWARRQRHSWIRWLATSVIQQGEG